jgi:hypothetical protein
MSSRFHNKYHRHNHHTIGVQDPRYPDAGGDPIASYTSPFLGNFVMLGSLSASVYLYSEELRNSPAAYFNGYNYGIRSIVWDGGTAIEGFGNANITGILSAANITYTGNVIKSYNTPLTATGEFLEFIVNGEPRAIRLWQIS